LLQAVVMTTYYLAQLLIALSTFEAGAAAATAQ
jgi:hypothetical protein